MKTKRVCHHVEWDKSGKVIRRMFHDVPVVEAREEQPEPRRQRTLI